MEAVGYKLTRIPRQLLQKPALINSFGKGVIGGINGIRNFGMGTPMTLQSSLSPLQSPSINSFSTIRGIENAPEFVPSFEKPHQPPKKRSVPTNPSNLRSKKESLLNGIIANKGKSNDVSSQVMELLSLPYELDIRDYTRVLQSCNTFSLSSLVMQEVKRRGLTPDIMLYNVFLKKCEEFKNKDEAFETYKTMIDSNVTPDRHTMSILIRSCLAVDKPSEAESLLKRMLLHGIDLNSYVFNVVIDYYARKALPLEAFRIRENMATYSIKPDEYTISSLMAACYPVAPSKLYLQQLLQDLVQGPLPARAVCTNALFSGIAKAPHLENHYKLRIAVDFHSELERRSYTVGQHAYTSLMSCCAKVGDVAQARRFLGSMQRGGVEPNRYILTAFIAACSKAKDYRSALTMFDYMRSCPDAPSDAESKRPNRYTYEALVLAAGNAGELADAFAIFQDMVDDGFQPDASSYAKLVLACGICGNLQRGQHVIDVVEQAKLPKTSFFYHSMIDLYSRCGQLDRAVAVLDSVRNSRDVQVSHYHYEPIVKLLAERAAWGEVDAFLKEWGDVSYSTYLFLITDCYKRGLWDRVLMYKTRMEDAGHRPYASLLPLIEDAERRVEDEKSGKKAEENTELLQWSDLDFDLDFDMDSNDFIF